MSMGFDKGKFRFSETFNNSDGKTSGSGFVGVWLGLIGGFGFICGTFGYFFSLENTMEYLGLVIQLIAASAILMGARKMAGAFKKVEEGKAGVVTADIAADVSIAEGKAEVASEEIAANSKEVKAIPIVDTEEDEKG